MTMDSGDHRLSPEALEALGELLQAAEQYNLGVAFEPDGEGWRVSYILHGWPAYEDYELPAGALADAYDLHIAASAALKPLIELGRRAQDHFAKRDR